MTRHSQLLVLYLTLGIPLIPNCLGDSTRKPEQFAANLPESAYLCVCFQQYGKKIVLDEHFAPFVVELADLI
jgi:hypothetical protein